MEIYFDRYLNLFRPIITPNKAQRMSLFVMKIKYGANLFTTDDALVTFDIGTLPDSAQEYLRHKLVNVCLET